MSYYYPDGCTQEDVDRAAGGYDEGWYCNWCEERVDDEHECPGLAPEYYADIDMDPCEFREKNAVLTTTKVRKSENRY